MCGNKNSTSATSRFIQINLYETLFHNFKQLDTISEEAIIISDDDTQNEVIKTKSTTEALKFHQDMVNALAPIVHSNSPAQSSLTSHTNKIAKLTGNQLK